MADQAENATPAPAKPRAAKDTKRVTLRTVHGYSVFVPSGDLPEVTVAGTEYTSEQADEVRTQAKKYGVRVVVVQPEED